MLFLILYFCVTVFLSLFFFSIHHLIDHIPTLQQYVPFKPTIYLIGLTLAWYSISVSFTIFNKWFLRSWHGGFHYPIMGTALHMIIKLVLTRVWYQFSDIKIPSLDFKFDLMVVTPIGVVTALDVMFSNQALLYISVTMYTVLKSSILIWTFLFGVLFKLEEMHWLTGISVLMICIGISAAVYSADQEELSVMGIVYCLAAAASGGLRWTLTQFLMREDPSSSNVMVAIYRFAPSAAVAILPIAMLVDVPKFESDSESSSDSFSFDHPYHLVEAMLLLLCGGLISFLLIGVEVYLLQLTTSLSMGILGQLKEVVQITLAMLVFHDHLDTQGVIGIVVALTGAHLYRQSRLGGHRGLSHQVVASPSQGSGSSGNENPYKLVNADEEIDARSCREPGMELTSLS